MFKISEAGSSQPINIEPHEAYTIFHNLESEEFTQKQKLIAIHQIINMETHNSVSKDTILTAFRWLFNHHYEMEKVCADSIPSTEDSYKI